MKYREAGKELRKLDCVEIPRRGSGLPRKWYNPASDAKTTLPDWRSENLRLGTWRSAVKDLGFE